MADKYYVYILECADGTFYTGYTTDIDRRLRQHNSGKGAKYTRGRIPCVLRYFRCYNTKSEALRQEAAIKRLTRDEKLAIILSQGLKG